MKTHLGSNIKFLRRMKGLTQAELASIVGINRNKIASYEAGIVEPQFAILAQLVEHLDTDFTSILTEMMEQNVLEVFEQPADTHDTQMFHGITPDLEDFILSTNNAQKAIDGFQEMFVHTRATSSNQDLQLQSLYSDLDNLVELVGKLLKVNWDFTHALQGLEDPIEVES